ncbi:MAG: N-acetylmuramoyl-L-alanine amidase [Candidatus Omnitrophota bacterium]
MKKLIWIIFALAWMTQGCATAPSVDLSTEELSLKDLCQRYGIQWQLDSVSQVVKLNRGSLEAKALVGSTRVILGDEKITLSAPVSRQRGSVYVPYDFKTKVINRLIKETGTATQRFGMVVIDAGHGGRDPGATGITGLVEKDVNLEIARKVKRILENNGIRVKMTRDRDEYLTLEERAQHVDPSEADLFVSIHANASTSRRSSGLEIYCLKDLDDRLKREIRQEKIYQPVLNSLDKRKNDETLDEILLDMLYAHKQGESEALAKNIAEKMAKDLNADSGSCRTAGFAVLKNTLVPAILVEVGYLSNKKEEELLRTESYRQKVAESLAQSILQYVRKTQ